MLKFVTDNGNSCLVEAHSVINFTGRSFRQRVIIILFITAPILASIITVPVSASDQAGMNAILLKKRQFVPEVVEKLEISKITGHAIIQFEKQPDGAIINILARHQVNVLEWIPRNAVMAYIPEIAQVEAIPGIRWIGKINPTDKISDHLNQSLTKGFILVDVYPDVTDQRARSVIFKVQGEIIENHYLAPKTYLVRATEKIAAELSTVDEVSWIWPASDAIINGEPVRRCGGILTTLGPLPNYVKINEGWDGPGQGSASLKYHFVNGTSDMSGEEYEVEYALAEWAKYSQLTWTETSLANQNRSVDIKWATGCHGDPYCFDGPDGVIAHAFSPPPDTSETLAGDVHFDDAESWCNGCYCYDTDLFSVALHEIGHSLGLDESDNSDAVMYPYYQCWSDEPEPLHQDDIDGIRSIYASKCHSCSITVTAPSSSNTWECGNCYYITWNSVCNRGNEVKLELYKGSSLAQTITSSTPDDGSYYWCVPESITSGSDYRVKISDKSDSSCASDLSDYFEITCPCTRVTSPSGSSIWECGKTYTISWSRTPIATDMVDIWLTKGAGWWSIDRTEDDGSYSWKVPTWLESGCGYWVRVQSTLDSSCYGESDTFCITAPPDTTPPSPNPMTWNKEPYATSTSSISMIATTATDSSTPVYYEFDFYDSPTGGSGGTDSGWQTSTTYTDSGLQPNHQYRYRVHARDSAPSQNTNTYSTIANSYTYANSPSGALFSNVTQTSIQANWSANGNSSGTQYLCENTTEDTNSGWTSNTYWNESGLNCNTQYCYQVRAKNGDGVETSPTSLGCQGTLPCPRVTLTASAGPNGSIYPSGTFDVNEGNDQPFTAEPNAGYIVDQWYLDSSSVQQGNTSYTLYNVQADHDVLVTFIEISPMDLNNDGILNFSDFAIFAFYWMDDTCSDPDWCEGSDSDYSGRVDFVDLLNFVDYWLWCWADLDSDGAVNFTDYAIFAHNWTDNTCCAPDWCEGTDFDHSGSVDILDLATFARYWLEGI